MSDAIIINKSKIYQDIDFRSMNLKDRIDFVNSEFIGCNMTGMNLEGANFKGCSFIDVNLTRANLKGALLADVKMSGVKIKGADFSDADLSQSCMVNMSADLVNFSGAVMDEFIQEKNYE